MQGAFIQSLTYNPPSVLGRQLLPFSPWHGLILEAAGSPYLCGGIPNLDDLILGVWVCSHGFTDGYKLISDVGAAGAWGKAIKKTNFSAGRATFAEHIAASFVAPRYWQASGGGELKSPYFWHCAFFAMRDLHLPESQAWDYPIAKIACYQACHAERQGNKDLMSAEEIKGLEILRQDEEKARKK